MKKKKNKVYEMVDFFFEIGLLKCLPRTGWYFCWVKTPESVADHSFRMSLIAYFLAKMKNVDAEKCLKMAIMHDIHEARINDIHKVGSRYLDNKKIAKKVIEEQSKYVFLEEYKKLMQELFEEKTIESTIVKDADYLECAFQAKEYLEAGYENASDWLNKIKPRLKTREAKIIFKALLRRKSMSWWKDLKVLR
ncbi:MAG: HD domain-containing protein [Candidatus Diapherotrites archaeon]|nr:HD domain-containing protein [Candidatus Diapherotrites archaeon]